MRTNHAGITENAEFNVNREIYEKEHVRIFGEKKDFCEKCEKRIAWCECEEHEKENE